MTEAARIISEFLTARGWSQAVFAEVSGVPQQTISNILSGRAASARTQARLRAVYGLGRLQPEDFLPADDAA